jgi:dTDP-4-amino-4,6-dideoxygalactose transaminase
VDIDPRTYNIDPALIEAAINPRTRAIIPVHLYGQCADMAPILEVASRRNLVVIEDAAQAIGAEYKGRRAGSLGHMGCLSFFPSKNLGGLGDGGMVTTNDPALADRVKLLRTHGYRPKYYNKVVGGNFRLDPIQAAVLRVKFRYLDSWTAARQRNAGTYRRLIHEGGLASDDWRGSPLKGTGRFVLPIECVDGRHVYNQFVIRSDRRDTLMAFLKKRNIGTEIYYPVPMHVQECFTSLGYKAGDFPASERAAAESLALPIYPELSDEMIGEVVRGLAGFLSVERIEDK